MFLGYAVNFLIYDKTFLVYDKYFLRYAANFLIYAVNFLIYDNFVPVYFDFFLAPVQTFCHCEWIEEKLRTHQNAARCHSEGSLGDHWRPEESIGSRPFVTERKAEQDSSGRQGSPWNDSLQLSTPSQDDERGSFFGAFATSCPPQLLVADAVAISPQIPAQTGKTAIDKARPIGDAITAFRRAPFYAFFFLLLSRFDGGVALRRARGTRPNPVRRVGEDAPDDSATA